MLWFAIQLVPLLVAAIAVGVVVGWLIWARSLRTAREVHRSDVAVLRTQVASLGDESRRLQQRFAGLAVDLDGSRLEVQGQLQELATTREAFRMSQANLATAESEISQLANVGNASQAELDRLLGKSISLQAEFEEVGQRLDESQAEIIRLSGLLESSTSDAARTRVEFDTARSDFAAAQTTFGTAQTALAATERLLDASQRDLAGTQQDLASTRRDLDGVRRQLDEFVRVSDTARDEALLTQTNIRTDAESAIAMLRRLWAHAEADRLQIERRLGASQRSVIALQGQQVAMRKGFVSSITALDAAKQHAITEAADARNEQLSQGSAAVKREGSLRSDFETRMQGQAESHRLVIEHWRRDLHQRFDEIETQKTNMRLRDEQVSQLERQLVGIREEVRAETRAHVRAEHLDVVATRERETVLVHTLKMEALRADYDARVHELVTQVETIDARLTDSLASLEHVSAERAAALGERDAALVALAQSRAAAEHAQAAAEHSNGAVEAAQEKVRESEINTDRLSAHADQLSDHVELLEGRLSNVQGNLDRVSFERHGLEEERDRLSAMLATLVTDRDEERVSTQRMIVSLEHDNSGLSDERVVLRTALSDLHEERELLSTQLAEVHSQNELLLLDIAAVEQSRVELHLAREEVSQRLGTTVEERDSALSERDSALSERDSVLSERDSVEAQRSILDAQLADSFGANEHQQAVIAKLHDQLVACQQLIDEKERSMLAAEEREVTHQKSVSDASRRDELAEADHIRREKRSANRIVDAEAALAALTLEASGWQRELAQLRQLYVVSQANGRGGSLSSAVSISASTVVSAGVPRRIRPAKVIPEVVVAKPVAVPVERDDRAKQLGDASDNLQRIEGIGPKIEAALKAAGVSSFVRLEAASPSQLRDALASAGLTFAPSLVGWSKQAAYLVAGDEEGFLKFTEMLVAGRDERTPPADGRTPPADGRTTQG